MGRKRFFDLARKDDGPANFADGVSLTTPPLRLCDWQEYWTDTDRTIYRKLRRGATIGSNEMDHLGRNLPIASHAYEYTGDRRASSHCSTWL